MPRKPAKTQTAAEKRDYIPQKHRWALATRFDPDIPIPDATLEAFAHAAAMHPSRGTRGVWEASGIERARASIYVITGYYRVDQAVWARGRAILQRRLEGWADSWDQAVAAAMRAITEDLMVPVTTTAEREARQKLALKVIEQHRGLPTDRQEVRTDITATVAGVDSLIENMPDDELRALAEMDGPKRLPDVDATGDD